MKGIVQMDHELTTRIRTWGHFAYGFWKIMSVYGIYAFVIAAAILAATDQLVFWHFGLTFVTAYVVASLLQKLVRRHRPDFEHLTGYKMLIHTYSYPSAHSAVSASSATSLALMSTFTNPLLGVVIVIAMIIWAMLIGLSRIGVGVHYLADVIFGWLLGFVVALGYVLVFII